VAAVELRGSHWRTDIARAASRAASPSRRPVDRPGPRSLRNTPGPSRSDCGLR
jgi:hypothetical protein